MIQGRPIEILLAEDNPGDVDLTKEAFEEAKMANNLHVTEDGEATISFLKKEGEYENSPTPDIILLDLNLPKVSGHEILDFIKTDENLKKIPVVILTSSEAEEDVVKSYNLHANSFITKPVDLEKFLKVVKTVEDFWLHVVKLPEHKTTEKDAV